MWCTGVAGGAFYKWIVFGGDPVILDVIPLTCDFRFYHEF